MPCEGSQGQLSLLPGVSRGASASCSEPPDPRASPGDRPCRHRGTQVVSLESGESYWSSQTLGRDLPAWDSLEWMHSGHTTVSPLCGDWAPCPEQCELPDLCALGPRLSCRLPARALGTLGPRNSWLLGAWALRELSSTLTQPMPGAPVEGRCRPSKVFTPNLSLCSAGGKSVGKLADQRP